MLLGALHTFGKLALIAIVTLPIAGLPLIVILIRNEWKYRHPKRAGHLRVVSS